MPDSLQLVLAQMAEMRESFERQMDEMKEHFDEKMVELDRKVENHFGMCQQLCTTRMEAVEKTAEKVEKTAEKTDKRVDKLETFKNMSAGALVIISIFLSYDLISVKP